MWGHFCTEMFPRCASSKGTKFQNLIFLAYVLSQGVHLMQADFSGPNVFVFLKLNCFTLFLQ